MTKWTNGMKVKVSDSLDNVPMLSHIWLVTDQPTDWPTAWIARVAIRH